MSWLIRIFLVSALMQAFLLPVVAQSTARGVLPRTVLALYHSEEVGKPHWSKIHKFAEMPLNHLGITLKYHNIREGLPDLGKIDGLRGILAWFDSGTRLRDPLGYLKWAEAAVRSGKKLVILGDPGFREDETGKPVSGIYLSRFFRLLGIQDMDEWVDYTYNLEFLHKNKALVEFERQYSGFNPPFSRLLANRSDAISHLVVRKTGLPDTESHVVMTFPAGGYVADGYAVFTKTVAEKIIRQWLINPFEFFRLAFDTDQIPKPDCTTLAGRRIFYSHIDGDGWLNVTQIEEYRKQKWLSSKVILEEVIRVYPDLPVTVTAVAAEVDPEWSGTEESREIARALFRQPQVEIGSHTYSHPFDWDFFADNDIDKERPYLHKYPGGGWGGNQLTNRFLAAISKKDKKDYSYLETGLSHDKYVLPRAYARRPFDLDLEIRGSSDYLNSLAPNGKKTAILMWSGNTTPFLEAIRQTRMLGLYNINGGDSRFDREYPSYSWVSPIGRAVDGEIQIYSSNSNENTYTDLWRGRFHGFRYLKETLRNTEHPRRIKPLNIYYHMYSGERRASLNAVRSNLDYALSKEIIPMVASRYAAIAEGFYSTRIHQTGSRKWRIEGRKKLQTIRFDNAKDVAVNFAQSTGVVGQRHYQGSLYVYLDETVQSPELSLRPPSSPGTGQPFLIQSRWRVWDLTRRKNRLDFKAEGFGQPEMTWQVPRAGRYQMTAIDRAGIQKNSDIRVGNNRQLGISTFGLLGNFMSVTVIYKGKQ